MEQMINAELLKELRIKRSWTQEQLASTSGLSLRTVQRIEKQGACSLESQQALASVFEVDSADLQIDESEKKWDRHMRRVLAFSYLAITIGTMSSFTGTTYSVINGHATGREAGFYYLLGAAIAAFSYVFVALLVEYFRNHNVGRWQQDMD